MKNTTKFSDKWLIFSLVATGIFMSTLDGSIVNIALPAIMHDIKAPLATTEWILIIYLLIISSLLLSFGRLSDIKGRRIIYSGGLFVFTIGSLFCAIAPHVLWLITARSFQGLGAAMIMSCTQALVVDIFPESERGKALGMIGAIVAAGLSIGPALGGIITHHLSWRFIFYINLPIGFSASLISFFILKGSQADTITKESFDYLGSLFLIFCICSFILAVTHGYEWGYNSWELFLLICFFVIVTGLFIFIEFKIKYPVVKISLFYLPLFTFPILSAITLFMSLFTMIFLMPFYLMLPCAFSNEIAGYIMVIPFIFLFVVAPISGALSDKTGSRGLCTLGMLILTIGLFFLSNLSKDSTILDIAWRLALAGIGTAIFISPNSAAAMTAVPAKNRGVAAGIVATARNLGMVLGVALAGAVFNSTFYTLSGGYHFKAYNPSMEQIFMTSFHYAMLSGSIVAGTGAILAYLRGNEKSRV